MNINAVDKEWIFEIFNSWVTISAIEQFEDENEIRHVWLHYVDVLQKKISHDWELSVIMKDIERVNSYLNYDYIQDFPKKISDYPITEGFACEVVMDNVRFKKEQKIYDNWDEILNKHKERSEKASKIKISCIGEMLKLGLDSIHSKREEKYTHFKHSQEKMQKRDNYLKHKDDILIPLMEERDIRLNRYIEETIKLIAEAHPTLFCKKIKKSTYHADLQYESLLRDAFNEFRGELIQEYKNDKILFKHHNTTSISAQNDA